MIRNLLAIMPAIGANYRRHAASYSFSQTPISQAVKERYRFGQSEIIQYNDASRNIYQNDGSVLSFVPNEVAFIESTGVINQDASTNKNTNYNVAPIDATGVSLISGDGAAPSVVVIPAVPGAGIFSASNDNGNIYALDCTGATVATVYEISGATANTNPHSGQLVAYSTASGALFGISSNITVPIPTSGFDRLKQENQTPSSGTDTLRFSVPAGAIVYFKYNQLEQTKACSSLIEVAGLAALRTKDNTQLSTFLEKGVWQDDNCGISGSTGVISLVGNKYDTLGSASLIGAMLRNHDSSFALITAASASSITVDNDVQAGAVLDLTLSDYWAGDFTADTASVSALRTAAGDDVSAIPAARLWDGSNFRLGIDLKYIDKGDGNGHLWSPAYDVLSDTNTNIQIRSADNKARLFMRKNGSTFLDIIHPYVWTDGEDIELLVDFKANDTCTLTINGVSASSTSTDFLEFIDPTQRLGARKDGNNPMNFVIYDSRCMDL